MEWTSKRGQLEVLDPFDRLEVKSPVAGQIKIAAK